MEIVKGARVLTARHVGQDRLAPAAVDDVLDPATVCQSNVVPDAQTYLKAINVYGVILFSAGGLAVLALLLVYLVTMRSVMRCRRADVKTNSALVTAVYPVVGVASYCAMIVPRAQLLAEAITQGAFMVSMYQLFCLIVAYCGGEAELVRGVKPGVLETRVAPCCCWPCCLIPRPQINKRTLLYLRLLVLQLPVVQGAVYIVLLVMWADEQSLDQVNYMYVQPVVIVSIMSGVWGVMMACRAAETCSEGTSLKLKGKFLALQLVLVAAKLQGTAARLLPSSELLPCRAPITPAVYVNLIYNCLILGEMLLLAIWAKYLYSNAPDTVDAIAPRPNIQQVRVMEDDSKATGVTNKCYDNDKY